MRTTVTLDDDVYEAAQHLARVSGERLGTVLSSLARRGLTPPAAPSKSSSRFPTFEVPPGSPIIPASRIQRIMMKKEPPEPFLLDVNVLVAMAWPNHQFHVPATSVMSAHRSPPLN